MLNIHRITGGWLGLRMGREAGTRTPRRVRRRDVRLEVLEGRALLSFYLVDSPGDSGTGEGFAGDLRYAINQADQARGNSIIVFDPALDGQTIALSLGPLRIDKPSGTLTILGPGADELAVSGGHQTGVLAVLPGSKVSISGLTVTGGIATEGGGISNEGQLTLADCTITGNTAANSGGGGIVNSPLGTMRISDSTIDDNISLLTSGGGISNAGTMTIVRSTISANACRGGGTNGGGISNAGTMTMVNDTISGNRALYGYGGGIANTSSLTMADDTVSDNTAGIHGGGIANSASVGGTISMDNTIVGDNVSTLSAGDDDLLDDSDAPDFSHLLGGNDLVESGDVGMLTNTITGVDPLLGPLQDNGGPTLTQALLPGSPAIGAGNVAFVPAGTWTDQRGIGDSRVVNGQVDMGGFEVQEPRRGGLSYPILFPHVGPSDGALIGLTIVPSSQPVGADPPRGVIAGARAVASPGVGG